MRAHSSYHASSSSIRPEYDDLILNIINYVYDTPVLNSKLAVETAKYCLLDSIGCALLALNSPACTKLLGPLVPESSMPNGSRVLGTDFELDPIEAAFNNGALIRWLDFNDTWVAAEWGHPSDNLGAILACLDYLHRSKNIKIHKKIMIQALIEAMIKAHEVQGVLALNNSFNKVGLDHVLLVRIASTAVSSWLLGATKEQACAALSQAWIDGSALRTYRHAPNAGPRKSWAAGDASARAVRLSLLNLKGGLGCPSALTAKRWGFQAVCFEGKEVSLERALSSYVMENILFKISYPAEFHAQTAVEAAIQLHPKIINKLDQVKNIEIETTEAAIRILDKTGPLNNPADRDHCLQYMVAIALLYGNLSADHYEDYLAVDLKIDALRTLMLVRENREFTQNYLDPEKRAIGNAITIIYKDGSRSERICIEYPLGHRARRQEALPLLMEKARKNISSRYDHERTEKLMDLFTNPNFLFQPIDCLFE